MEKTYVARQDYSYKQGLVLGLTLAELLLLLCFCLLLAVGSTLSSMYARQLEVESASASAKREHQLLTDERDASRRIAEALRQKYEGAGVQSDNWTKLVEAQKALDELERNGIGVSDLAEAIDQLRALKGTTSRKSTSSIIDDFKMGEEVRSVFGGTLSRPQIVDRIRALVKEPNIATADTGRHRWPPIIDLSEADGFFFASGRAELQPGFAEKLNGLIVPKLLELAKEYDIDTIEVVGHTDEQRIAPRPSNWDTDIAGVLAGASPIGALRVSDNAALGLARAVAVVKQLVQNSSIQSYRVLPYSGGQLIDRNQRLTRGIGGGDIKERRRIEIRLRKSAVQ